MVNRRASSLGVILIFLCAVAEAGSFPVFGPKDYQRDTAQPVTLRESFAVAHTAAPYRLRIANGGAAGQFAQVTSAVITVNGREVFGQNDFTGRAPAVMEKPITVGATNELTIELRGNPGAGLTLTVLGDDNVPPTITAAVSPQPNANGWNEDLVTVTFSCSDSMTGITQCSAPVTVSTEGANQSVTGTATDGAGNAASRSVSVNIDKTGGSIAATSPADGAVLAATQVDVTGNVSDALSGVASAQCNTVTATISGSTFTCRVPLADGLNSITLTVTDRAGIRGSSGISVRSDTTAPVLTIGAPSPGTRTNVASIEVSGDVTDDDEVAELRVGGAIVPVLNRAFTATVPLVNGANDIVVTAKDRAGNTRTTTLQATRFALPQVKIASPSDLVTVRDAAVTVSGTIAEATSVTVNGVAASVSGTTFTASGIPLAQGRTVITATATNASGAAATDSILVYRDAIPPRVVLRHPLDGAVLVQPRVDVSGMIDDIVVGTVNSGQARVTVNGVQAEVANRAFIARNVPLNAGPNTLTIVATDQGGNAVTLTSAVTYDAAARAKIEAVSGGGQSAVIGDQLPAPLVVRLVNADGTPAANRTVSFEVVENNGMLAANGIGGRTVSATTGANGQASATWVVGAHAGAGNNRVRAGAAGFGAVDFQASGRLGAASLIVVDAGNTQYGAFGAPLPRPLVAAVVDPGSNRVPNVPVTFTIAQGGGRFENGAQSVTVHTDSDGRAWTTPVLGQEPLTVVIASIPGSQATATFQAFGKLAGPPSETRISGVVLDNTDLPIPGVSVRIDGSTATVQSNDAGQFTITGAPVGYVKLLVDGSTARRPGTWPTLEYAMYTIPGANNTLEMPIYLLPIDVRRGLFVDEVNGGTLTLPELPGFSLTVKPGSATFPGGSRTGTVSVTMVHADKMPMAPGFGQQPRFIVTIQPPGVHFDPPAAISFPNVDGYAPGEVTEMYSFDHDLGQFVSIGTASVSQNGAILSSDPGVGIIKGGWHCGGNPPPGGTPHCCPRCKTYQNNQCLEFTGDDDQSSNPEDRCCGGDAFKNTTHCCKTPEHVVVTNKFTHIDDCPNYRAKPSCGGGPPGTSCWDPSSGGCSIPPWMPFPQNDPLGGGPATAFSNQVPGGFNGDRPCDDHDRCYQTCHPLARKQCDDIALAHMQAICAANSPGNPTVASRCAYVPNLIYTGLRLFGFVAFDNNMEKACFCC